MQLDNTQSPQQYVDSHPQLIDYLRSNYLVFEGLDGSGKSTLLSNLSKCLAHYLDVKYVREPGSTPFGEQLRHMLLQGNFKLEIFSELLLFMAARNELLHKEIVPALAKGQVVLSDRCYISSYAYQFKHCDISRELFSALVEQIYKQQQIKVIVYCDIDAQLGLQRSRQVQMHDNIESKGSLFYQQTTQGYLEYRQHFIAQSQLLLELDGQLDASVESSVAKVYWRQADGIFWVDINALASAQQMFMSCLQCLNFIAEQQASRI